jgi:hypothetical protein
MALQQQKQAIAEAKPVEEQNIKIRAQIASVSSGAQRINHSKETETQMTYP